MAKLELVGKFHEVGDRTTVGEKNTNLQQVVFLVFGYVNRAQGIENPDEPWKLDVIGKKVEELNLTKALEGTTARITVYIEGYSATTKENRSFFGYKVNLTKYEPISHKA